MFYFNSCFFWFLAPTTFGHIECSTAIYKSVEVEHTAAQFCCTNRYATDYHDWCVFECFERIKNGCVAIILYNIYICSLWQNQRNLWIIVEFYFGRIIELDKNSARARATKKKIFGPAKQSLRRFAIEMREKKTFSLSNMTIVWNVFSSIFFLNLKWRLFTNTKMIIIFVPISKYYFKCSNWNRTGEREQNKTKQNTFELEWWNITQKS